jgi:hypothetical protein
MMKQWPKSDKPASFDDVVGPLVRAVRFAYDLKRKNSDKDIPYTGYDIGRDCAANCLGATTKLSAKSLRYNDEDQGRDVLETIIELAIQIGIEQGRRITMTGPIVKTMRLELLIAKLNAGEEVLESLKDIML